MDMLLQEKIGHLNSFEINNRSIELLSLEWYETKKRILRKLTNSGREVSLKFMDANPSLTDGDILFADEHFVIAITVLPCHCIVLQPTNMFEMASLCYEIGNKHLPLFYEEDQLLVPFELPLFSLLQIQGYEVKEANRKLLQPLKTTVAAHPVISDSLFSKAMKLTNTAL